MIERFKDIIYNIFFREKVTISSDESLRGKVVIITGASKGIGKSTAEILLRKGAKVALISRGVSGIKQKIKGYGEFLLIPADVTSKTDCERVVNETIKKFGNVDVLINNAGIFKGGLVEDILEKDWDLVMSTNLKGVFLMTKAVVPVMKKNKSGLIINIGSKISRNAQVSPQKVVYATTKYAVEGFSYALSRELRSFGIRVSCLMPATVKTFRTVEANKYLSPYEVGKIILLLIQNEKIHFEELVFKSIKQDI